MKKNKEKLIVANWKAYLNYQESKKWFFENSSLLPILCNNLQKQQYKLIICPSFEALSSIFFYLNNYQQFYLGAQDCCAYQKGAYTGQVLAESLAQIGVSYAIVNHSELKIYYKQKEMVQKAEQLLNNSIKPIICLGEIHKTDTAIFTIEKQLRPYRHLDFTKICIAYEPIWAIGSSFIPDIDRLEKVFTWLRLQVESSTSLLYGGNINEKTIKYTTQIKEIDGFIIGRASSDIQKLKNMLALL